MYTYVGKHEIVVLPVWEAPDEKLDARKERVELGISEKHELDISVSNIPCECFEISNDPGRKLLSASIESRLLLKTTINKPILKLNTARLKRSNVRNGIWMKTDRRGNVETAKARVHAGLKTVHLLRVNKNAVCTVHFYVLSTPRFRDQRTSRSMREVDNIFSATL
ncbi:hypothetical protein V1478_004739 [Vespula squamosa]|uniref:Uncharacterized protein n=1 Tax=Vespula squamosa TaxID=30214 RepID=A0ABD2BH19_VESSQ